MRTIGSRELKRSLGEVLRQVRERDDVYVVSLRGRRIARLIPESSVREAVDDFEEVWSEMDRLAEEIAREWPAGIAAAEAVGEDRRDL